MSTQRIHQDQPVLTHGASLDEAKAAVILLHGRGATAQSMLELAARLPAQDVAYLMPQAANQTWYPNSGFGPLASNEPFLSSAMATIEGLIQRINAAGIPTHQIVIGGFSQGACLGSEFVAQHAVRYGGLLVLSGALMGPLDMARDYPGTLADTPVFIGGIDQDPWVTETQLRHTASVIEQLGGQVALAIVPGSQHTIRPPEVVSVAAIIEQVKGAAESAR